LRFSWLLAATTTAGWAVAAVGQTAAIPLPDREEQLWQRVTVAARPVATTQPYRAWLAAARRQREELLDSVRLYQMLYPGGRYRQAALRSELVARFELVTLGAGTFEEFRQRIEQLAHGAADPASRAEAAYWRLICRDDPTPVAPPDTGPLPELDEPLLSACQSYVRDYPDSPYTPRLAELLFDAAARRDDRNSMEGLVSLLRERFSSHVTTGRLEGRWRRYSAVGLPFWPELPTVGGPPLTQADYLGHPVAIVVWAAFDEHSRGCVRSLEQLRRVRVELRVIGYSLDESRENLAAACQELEIDWPQCNDGMGWGGRFARHWGIDRLPVVFVLDRGGRLLGTAGADGWEALVRQALRGGAADMEDRVGPGDAR